jgi:CHASE2 domain-containing sensor protein
MSTKANPLFNASELLSKFRTLQQALGSRTTLIAVLIVLAIWTGIFLWEPATWDIETGLLDLTQNFLMGWRAAHPELLIVDIDSETLAGVPHRWPWPRTHLNRLLTVIDSGNPRFIILDIFLQKPNDADGGAGDQALAQTLKKLGNVALVAPVDQDSAGQGLKKTISANAPVFRSAVGIEGFVWGLIDRDGVFRSFVCRDILFDQSSCALQVAEKFRSNLTLPPPDTEGRCKTLLSFANRNGEIPSISALQVLNGNLPPETFQNKIVLIGATAQILHDYFRTSRGSIAGVRILATTLDTFLSNRIVRIHEGWTPRLMSSILGLLSGILGPLLRIATPLPLAFSLMVLGFGAWMSLLASGTYLPIGPFLLAWLLGIAVSSGARNLVEILDRQTLLSEANAAGEIQRQFFPPMPFDSPGYLARGLCLPCTTAGGDLYDYLSPQEGRLSLLLIDVSGHGIGAAMVTSMLKALVFTWKKAENLPLEDLVKSLNFTLCEVFPKKRMATGVFFDLDENKHTLTMACIGQTSPYLVRRDGSIEELKNPGFPLGHKGQLKIKLISVTLNEGDTVIMYTDGIVESLDWKNKQYGYDRWCAFLQKQVPLMTPETPVERLLTDVQNYAQGRPPDDDMTVLLLHRKITKAEVFKC